MRIVKKALLDETLMARFMTETLLLRTFDHPNILHLNEIYQDRKRFFVVTELCHGGELFDKVSNDGNFGEKEAAEVMRQLLSALFYLHEREIIHRDLKLENLVYQDKEQKAIKLIDFGETIIRKKK